MKWTRSTIKNIYGKMGMEERSNPWRQVRYLFVMVFLLAMVMPVYGRTIKKVQKQVKMSIDTQQETQKKQEKWEAEKQEIKALYDQLTLENQALAHRNLILSQNESKHQALIQDLEQEKIETFRIQREMIPFLQSTLDRLEMKIENDPPFLKKERQLRLKKLKDLMEDIDSDIGEKYRRVMEALFVEAGYGNTMEVYQEKILVSGQDVLGNILRLGRVSLFFLSLDQTSAPIFNVSKNQWLPLDKVHVPGVVAGVEMAAKRRPVELVFLPLGRLGRK